MIVWTRWGILVFVFCALSAALGYLLQALLAPRMEAGAPEMSFFIGGSYFVGAAALWAFCAFALPKLDKAQPLFVHEKLAEPVMAADESKHTHRRVPVLHPETGEQLWQGRRSSFFFIPMRFWPVLMVVIGVVFIIVGITKF